MRLTLRTLLAHLDGILEPNDAQDIGKKVEESEYATGLVHRIHDVMRRLRLGAPSLTDKNPRLNVNTVAEYLDNTLASEGVTDFEKVCLDSDVHLAEVAACHQILTLVLGEPAEIDPASRQRMYELKDAHVASGPPPSPAMSAAAPVTPVGATPTLDLDADGEDIAERKPRLKPTVPEYLREPRRRGRWLPVVAVLLIVCFLAVVLMALGQFMPGTPLGNILVQWGLVEAPNAQEIAVRVDERTVETAAEAPTDATASDLASANGPALDAAKGLPAGLPTQPAAESTGAAAKSSPTAPVPPTLISADTALPNEPNKQPGAEPSSKNEPVKGSVEEPAKAVDRTPSTDLAIKDVGVAGRGTAPAADAKNVPDALTTKTDGELAPLPDVGSSRKGEGEAGAKLPPAPLPPEPLARLMSSDQVLLKEDEKSGWMRVAANQMLIPQRLLVLPTYRAKVTLTAGVTLEILGGTEVELLASGAGELPGIHVFQGRVVLMPLAQAGSRLRLTFGERAGMLTFADAESVAALEVQRLRVPGSNPEAGPPHIVAKLYGVTGSIVWNSLDEGQDAKAKRLSATEWIAFNAGVTSEAAIAKELPAWIAAMPISALDRRASAAIAQALPSDRLARLGLLELATSRPQKEVRWLALRCLGCIGQHHDMVAALNDAAHKLEWPEYIEQLREAVNRDADSAKTVRMALEKQYPQQSNELYRMLWGYTDKDLQAGADQELVKSLDDELLAVRVLGYWNLKDLTGLGASYRPEQTAAKRQQPIRRWRDRLEVGEIRLKTAEEKAGAAAREDVAPLPGAAAAE
jgi:hypothetical protein